MKRTFASACLILLAAASAGYTNCEYYKQVTVPATDTKPPIVVSRVFIDGVETLRVGPITETITDPGAIIFAIGSIYDSGGARSVTMAHRVEVRCHNYSSKPQLGQLVLVKMFPITDIQPGGVGSKVSNGNYVYFSHSLQPYTTYCAKGFSLEQIRYQWQVSGADFHGNVASLPLANEVTYTP